MLLIGTMDWSSTRGRGIFQCPNCESSQEYRLRESRPFLTLYFIPIVPLGGLTESVECRQCREHYEPVILSTSGSDTQGAATMNQAEVSFEQDLRNLIALIMIEDGQVTENEIGIARRLYENITETNLTRDDLGRTCSSMSLHRLSARSYLATAAERRNHQERLLLVQAMFGVAGADGEISTKRMQRLVEAQTILNLEEREFKEAISNTGQWLA